MAADARRRELALAQTHPRSAFELADMVAGGSAGATLMGRASKEAAREVGLKDDEASRGGPGRKMAKKAARAGSLERIQRFGVTACRTNVMRSCELSLKSVASALRC